MMFLREMAVRYGSEQKARTHRRIVSEAARLFRDRGYEGCGVDAVMAAAGLTAGGFYSHFENKDALLAEALERCFATGAKHRSITTATGDDGGSVADWLDAYLSARHRDAPGAGCPIPALAAEVARLGGDVRGAFTLTLRTQLESLAGRMPAGSPRERMDAAMRTLAAAAGAMLLARAVDDPRLSDRFLRVVRDSGRPRSAKRRLRS